MLAQSEIPAIATTDVKISLKNGESVTGPSAAKGRAGAASISTSVAGPVSERGRAGTASVEGETNLSGVIRVLPLRAEDSLPPTGNGFARGLIGPYRHACLIAHGIPYGIHPNRHLAA